MPLLGMGCSRLGSLLAAGDEAAAEDAVRAALAAGISVFDTANVYGQGSSELVLGRVLPRQGVEICTKAGLVAPAPLWTLRLAKRALRPLAVRRAGLRGQVAARRAQSYPQRFDPAYLTRCLSASLRRLRRPHVEMLLLHNPPPDQAGRGELWRWVEQERQAGRIGAFGISCAGGEADRVWLGHPLLTVAQIPARAVLPAPGAFLADRRALRLRILVRELVGPGQHGLAAIGERLRELAEAPGVSVALLGMSSAPHVREAAALFTDVARARGLAATCT